MNCRPLHLCYIECVSHSTVLRRLIGCGAVLVAACGGSAEDILTCDDLLPATQAGYGAVVSLMVDPGPKSCSTCHNTATPVFGLNFEGPGVAYDALSTRMELIYPQIATGGMPKVGEPWSDGDLRILRTWYCSGAFYEDPTSP